jgi:hypothetical protein
VLQQHECAPSSVSPFAADEYSPALSVDSTVPPKTIKNMFEQGFKKGSKKRTFKRRSLGC